VSTLKAVWNFPDVANGLMAVPNLILPLALNGVVVSETRTLLWSGTSITKAEAQAGSRHRTSMMVRPRTWPWRISRPSDGTSSSVATLVMLSITWAGRSCAIRVQMARRFAGSQ
jgi:hypothetical protein